MKRRVALPAHERSSGNVFRDLGFDRPDDELAKANLIMQIADLVRGRSVRQSDVAACGPPRAAPVFEHGARALRMDVHDRRPWVGLRVLIDQSVGGDERHAVELRQRDQHTVRRVIMHRAGQARALQ